MRDHLEPDPALRQRTLFVRLLRRLRRPGFTLTPDNVRIDGGERLPVVPVEWVAAADDLPAGTDPALVDGIDDLPRTLVVRTAVFGDFSRYTLHLRAGSGSDQPPANFDPILSDIDFSFKVECPSDFDCAAALPCPPQPAAKPGIDYLAKDYTGFRRMMLDRLSLLAPGWNERSAADVGVMLVELLAYAADNLSYRQDAIANEAYLATAHKRVSVRRHARLVDYALHDGCNARAWVQVKVAADQTLPKGTTIAHPQRQSSGAVGAGQQGLARRARRRRHGVRDGTRDRALPQPEQTVLLHVGGPGLLPAARGDARHTARQASEAEAQRRARVPGSRESHDLQRRRRRSRQALGGAAHRREGGRRSLRRFVRRAAGERAAGR